MSPSSKPPSLCEAFGPHFELGCAVGGELPTALEFHQRRNLERHFCSLTPENCLKPGLVQPLRGSFEFDVGDAFVRYAQSTGMRAVGHTLVWHQQTLDWLLQEKPSASHALSALQEHIETVAGHFAGKLQGWDVVNEAVSDGPDPDEVFRPTVWREVCGQSYVEQAFRWARAADPQAELYYNDYNAERPGKREKTLRLLEQLLDAGVRLDGIGIQGHWQLSDVPYEDIEQAIDAYARLGLKVMITELDLDLIERPDCGADLDAQRDYRLEGDPLGAGCPDELLEAQAQAYAKLFRIFVNSAAVTRVTFWGLDDGCSWLNHWPAKRTNHPLLFDRSGQPKPAFDALLQVAGKHAAD